MRDLTQIRAYFAHINSATTIASLMCAAMLCVGVVGVPSAANAQQEAQGAASYITPFPKGDVYRVRVIGDYLAKALLPALATQMSRDGRLQFNNKAYWFDRVIRASFDAKLNELIQTLDGEDTNIAVVMLGPADRRSIRVKGKKRWPGDDLWRGEYSRRIDTVMKRFEAEKHSSLLGRYPHIAQTGCQRACAVDERNHSRTRLYQRFKIRRFIHAVSRRAGQI